MTVKIQTFEKGDYKAEIFDDNKVKVYFQNDLIDWPGPWADNEGACQWAEMIIEKYAVDGHQEKKISFGN